MSKKATVPLVGKQGILAILGAIVGVLLDKFLEDQANTTIPALATPIWEGFHVDDLIGLVVPLLLLVVTKRLRAFWIGMFCGALAHEVYEIATKTGGYT